MTRLAIVVEGIVQGVGFRPFVYGLASRFELAGFVRNHAGSVQMEIEGTVKGVEAFLDSLSKNPPPLAKIERLNWRPLAPTGQRGFQIHASGSADEPREIFISPDIATCEECLADLFDPGNRRYLYPFVNCTNCGPRLTIIRGAPYDRPLTAMAGFEMCPDCRAEYEDPANRRFHAQPICCPKCGPRLEVWDSAGHRLLSDLNTRQAGSEVLARPGSDGEKSGSSEYLRTGVCNGAMGLAPVPGEPDPIRYLADQLRGGKIAAIKGLGGYHLACEARNETTVKELRRRKHRDEKPFALMVPDLAAAQQLCCVSDQEAELLQSRRCPIVLLQKSRGSDLAESVAPKNPWLGIMLPYTPVHHLLIRQLDGMPLVMTSGNRSDEPISYDDADAVTRLAGIADLFLVHNRPIHVRCDDSVTRVVGESELPIRRSRGYAPQPVRLPLRCPVPTLAVGGQLKATFALGKDDHAFVSHHMGDLDHLEAARAFERDVKLYQELFEITPSLIVCDLHPDYISTGYAKRRASSEALELVAVQHHHAHLASCMAENGLNETVIGVTFDGTGFGTDGTIWGGEFLVGDYKDFQRAAHLRPVGMPGADKAIHEPWRMALSHLVDAGCDDFPLNGRIEAASLRLAHQMLARRFNTPITSSAGRLFDAVASLIGVRDRVSYEGQAAIEMENLATGVNADGVYPFDLSDDQTMVVDTRRVILSVVADLRKGTVPAVIARRFHSTMVDLIRLVCERIRNRTAITTAVLSGGVFLNALLSTETKARLQAIGFKVFTHRQVPPNDGGLSLGQLAIAAARRSGLTRIVSDAKHLPPSPGTPGEGWGEGFLLSENGYFADLSFSPNPLPEYRKREPAHANRTFQLEPICASPFQAK